MAALELRRIVQGRFNHPSIIMWVTFNEGWGLTLKNKQVPQEPDSPAEESKIRQQHMVAAVRQEDPTRLIDAESGAGGGKDTHPETLWDFGLGDVVDFHCYGGKEGPAAEARRAAVIGECGYGGNPAGSVRHWLLNAQSLGLSALVLTQLTDVENENNDGILQYGRACKEKIPPENTGAEIIDQLHRAGYRNYPGGAETPAR